MLKCIEEKGDEPVSREILKLALRIDSNEEDNFLDDLLKSARSLVENTIGRSLVKKRWVKLCHKADRTYTGGKQLFYLPKGPVSRIERVCHEGLHHETDLSDEDYKLWEADNRSFALVERGIEVGKSWIRLYYETGYDKPTDVPKDLCQAVLFIAADMYKEQANLSPELISGTPKRFLTPTVCILMRPYHAKRWV